MDVQMEVWEYIGTLTTWVPTGLDRYGTIQYQQSARVGQKFRVNPDAREAYENLLEDPTRSIFVKGSLRRVDKPEESPVKAVPEDDLRAMFKVRGMGFQAGVKKLADEPFRRLLRIAEESDISVAQQKFLTEHRRERFPVGGPTSQYEELVKSNDVAKSDTLE